MRLVVDTNVLISALLHPDRTPASCLARALAERVTVLLDARIEQEYREVLARPRFAAIDVLRRDALFASLLAAGEWVTCAPQRELVLVDDDDRMLVEVALSGRADALVTGNARHIPTTLGFTVFSPAALLAHFVGCARAEG
jgi:putative PIN family toxin of toxin-antitoxin system